MTTGNWQDDPLDPNRDTDPTAVRSTGREPEVLGVPPVDPGVSGTVPPPPVAGTTGGSYAGQETSTSDVAKDEARRVADEGKEAARHTAETAKGEARNVAHEAKAQARGLMDQVGTELRDQAGTQQQRVAEGLRAVADELQSMLRGEGGTNGTASNLVGQAADRAGSVAGWLEQRDPGSLVDDVKGFARRKPGAFLAIAAGAGILAGRLTRGLTGNDAGTTGSRTGAARTPAPPSYTPSAGTGRAGAPYGSTAPGPANTPDAGVGPLGGAPVSGDPYAAGHSSTGRTIPGTDPLTDPLADPLSTEPTIPPGQGPRGGTGEGFRTP